MASRVGGHRAFVLIAVVAVACQATDPNPTSVPGQSAPTGSEATGASSPPPSGTTIDPVPPPNPLDVTATIDSASTVTNVIGAGGGSLEFPLAGGSTATLSIPPDALIGDVEISMAGVSTLAGWNFAPAGLAAVQLTPDGLQLLRSASLTIKRDEDMSRGAVGEIAWAGAGEDLHPTVAATSANGATFEVNHFSGYGLTWDMNQSYWGDWEVYRARTLEAYIEQELATILGIERQRQLLLNAEPADLAELILDAVGNWYDWVYSSLMGVAGTSCENARTAAIAQETFARKIALIGLDINDVWQRFSQARVEAGSPLPYAFDKLSPTFMTTLIETCDRQALDECLATGDIVLLTSYVAQRDKLFDLAQGGRPPGTDDGSGLLKACGRYRLELDVTFAYDQTVSGGLGGGYWELFQTYERWTIKLNVDLQWEPVGEGREPWAGRIIGKAVPTTTVGSARKRFHDVSGTHLGSVDEGWTDWCKVTFNTGAWEPWPVELKTLDFHRERVQIVPPPIPAWVTGVQPQGPGPTFDYDGQLRTTSFISASVKFEDLVGPAESMSYACKDHSGSGKYGSGGGGMGAFNVAHPEGTNWTTGTGSLANQLSIKDAGSHPIIAKTVWTACDPAPPDPDVKWVLTCDGTLTLTHTAGP